jgi:diguanylate cyclase (GGDEF)-like protein
LEVAERMRSRIETTCGPSVIPGENVRITASFGLAAMSFGGSTLAEMIKQADQALYAAKAAGRNRVVRYDADIQSHPVARVAA